MQGKYNFIKLEKVIIRNFSLYKKKETVYEVNESIIFPTLLYLIINNFPQFNKLWPDWYSIRAKQGGLFTK